MSVNGIFMVMNFVNNLIYYYDMEIKRTNQYIVYFFFKYVHNVRNYRLMVFIFLLTI